MALVLSPVVGILITWKYKWTIFLLSPIIGSIGSFLFCIVTFNLFLDGTAAQLVMVAGDIRKAHSLETFELSWYPQYDHVWQTILGYGQLFELLLECFDQIISSKLLYIEEVSQKSFMIVQK